MGFLRIESLVNLTLLRLYAKENADTICNALKFCRVDPGKTQCSLFDNNLRPRGLVSTTDIRNS